MAIKVIRIMHRLSISGPTHHAAYLTHYLNKTFETQLISGMITPGEVDGKFIMDQFGIQPIYIESLKRSINPFQDFLALLELYRFIKKYKPQIVHTHAAKSGTLGRLAAYLAGVPIIIHTFHGHTFHSYFNPFVTKIFLAIERFLASKSTRIIAISEIQKKELTEQFKLCSPEKVVVIPLGFDLTKFATNQHEKRTKFRLAWNIDNNTIAIGIIGRLTKIKNHAMFLECISKLKAQTNKKIVALIVGDGELKNELNETCAILNLESNLSDSSNKSLDVIFTSWQEAMDEVINGLDIIALTSLNEGTPVTIIEALSAGKPVVSTNVGGVADIVEHGRNGFLTASNDTIAFTNHLLDLVNDSTSLPSLQDSAIETRHQFSYTRLVADVEKLYNSLLLEVK